MRSNKTIWNDHAVGHLRKAGPQEQALEDKPCLCLYLYLYLYLLRLSAALLSAALQPLNPYQYVLFNAVPISGCRPAH